jgi:hypothetical protein
MRENTKRRLNTHTHKERFTNKPSTRRVLDSIFEVFRCEKKTGPGFSVDSKLSNESTPSLQVTTQNGSWVMGQQKVIPWDNF